MKRKITEKTARGGKLEIYGDVQNAYFLAQPHGVINPELLDEDVNRARGFAKKINKAWSYISNTEDVWIVNPFNLLYLKEIKKIKKLKQIIIFAPNPLNRFLIKLVYPLVKPDKVFSKRIDFDKFMARVG